MKLIIGLGAASLLLGSIDQLTILFIRSVLVSNLGLEYNGIYQCVAGISNNYFSIFYLSISIYILPVLSEKKSSEEANLTINSAFRLTLLLIVPITSITFAVREFVILILYSDSFLPAGELMLMNFIGDFFKALSWVFGAWLIPASRIKLWLVLGVVYYANYVIIFMVLNNFGHALVNVVIAYALAGVFHFILNWYFISKKNNFKLSKISFKLFFNSVMVLALIFSFSEYDLNFGYALLLPLLLIWTFMSVSKSEMLKLFNFLSGKT